MEASVEEESRGHLGLPRKLEQRPRASYAKLWKSASTEPREALRDIALENARAAVWHMQWSGE